MELCQGDMKAMGINYKGGNGAGPLCLEEY